MTKTSKFAMLGLLLVIGAQGAQVAVAQEHGRPESGRGEVGRGEAAGRVQGRGGPPARADGRGQVLDGRYNHGRYYPPMGTVRPSLPEGYRPYYRGSDRFYFSGGVWYSPRGPG